MSIELQGLESIQRSLNNLSQALDAKQMKTTMNTIGGMITNTIEDSFESERSPWGEKWKPLKVVSYHLGYSIGKGKSPHTKKGKQSVGFSKYIENKKILRESGNLADKWLTKATSESVEVSGNAKSKKGFAYGAVHQWGSKKVPIRRFLPVDESGGLEPKLQEMIESYLEKRITSVLS
jgi:phage gpG-like protein